MSGPSLFGTKDSFETAREAIAKIHSHLTLLTSWVGFKVISSHCFSFFGASSCKIVVRVLSRSTKFSLLYYSLLNIVRKMYFWYGWYGIYCRYIINLHPSLLHHGHHSQFRFFPRYHVCVSQMEREKISTRFVDCTPSRVQGMCECKTHLWSLQKSFKGDVSCPLNFPAAKTQKVRVRIEAMTFQWSFTMCTLMSQQPIGCFGRIAVDGYWKHTVELTWYLPCNQERNTRSASGGGDSTSRISACSLKRLDVTWCSYLLYLLWSMQRAHLWFWKQTLA